MLPTRRMRPKTLEMNYNCEIQMNTSERRFVVKLAETAQELKAAQRLRYEVFISELGGDGRSVDHARRLEKDHFDPFFDHLILIDRQRDPKPDAAVVGVYRLLRSDQAQNAGRFYSEDEYDLSVLKTADRKLLELGRSCVHPDYRGGMAMYHLWQGLAGYVADNAIEILFGVASFHGTDVAALAQPLSLLHHRHLAPEDLRVRALPERYQPMNLIEKENLDRRAAMLQIPALIKAYLRLGGVVGDGACVDYDFNTVDVCLVMDTKRMNERTKTYYSRIVEGQS